MGNFAVNERFLPFVFKFGQLQKLPIYLIDWFGWGPEEDTWEPKSSLKECDIALKNFYKSPLRLLNGIYWRDLPDEEDRLWGKEENSTENVEARAAEYKRDKYITDDDVHNNNYVFFITISLRFKIHHAR